MDTKGPGPAGLDVPGGPRRPGLSGTGPYVWSGLELAAASEMSRAAQRQGENIELHEELAVAALPLSLPRRWLWFDKDFSFTEQRGWCH